MNLKCSTVGCLTWFQWEKTKFSPREIKTYLYHLQLGAIELERYSRLKKTAGRHAKKRINQIILQKMISDLPQIFGFPIVDDFYIT